ncbi:MAG: MATE family efflux transporter [Clostridia bacterium]|nr:MATE family efflux transporter [Clostridia bacterium]
MFKTKSIDATQGSLFKSIVIYSIPLMLSALIQTLFTSVDVAVLGYTADGAAIASVGATSTIISVLVNSFYGLSGGARVVLARLIGERNSEKIKQTVDTVFILVCGLGIAVSIIGFVFAPRFLDITKCPAECFSGASLYLRIYILSAPAMLVYNCGSAIISVDGDTRRPMYYILITGISKVLLNISLCMILDNKVVAVAVASFIANYLSASLVVIRLVRINSMCKLDFRNFSFSRSALLNILKFGIPSLITTIAAPISNLQIQTAVNSFGTETIAGNTAIMNVENVVAAFCVSSIHQTALTFVGQNIGADNPNRVKKSIIYCLALGGCIGLVLGCGSYIFGEPLLNLFIPGEAEAIEYGLIRGKYLLNIYWMISMTETLVSVVTAFGFTATSATVNLVTIVLTRLLWMLFVFPNIQTRDGLYMCFTVSWLLLFIFIGAIFIYAYFFKYKKGKIKKV